MFDGLYAMEFANIDENIIYKECRSCVWAQKVENERFGGVCVLCYHDPKPVDCYTRGFRKCANYTVDTNAIEKQYKKYRITDK